MSEKALDKHGRWRSVSKCFRCSPEEDEMIRFNVRLSGLTKQEYLVRRSLEKEITVVGSPRLQKALKDEVIELIFELKRLECRDKVTPELIEKAEMILDIYNKVGEKTSL